MSLLTVFDKESLTQEDFTPYRIVSLWDMRKIDAVLV